MGALELLRREGREYATTPEAIVGARDRLREAGVLVPGHAAGAKTAVAASVAGTHAAAAAEEAAR